MELITRERDRLLQRMARNYGLGFTTLSLACLVLPGAISLGALLWTLLLYLVLVIALWRMGESGALGWMLLVLVAGTTIPVVAVLLDAANGVHLVPAIMPLAAGAIAAISLVLVTSLLHVIVLVVAFLLTLAVALLTTATLQDPLLTTAALLLGWVIPALVGVWIGVRLPPVAQRIEAIGGAHRAERQASELEAQRRQSARLLHDTVLATLTLLAHSGRGVSAEALTEQARDDARLLRQLRLGTEGSVDASRPALYASADDVVLGTTLESVKQRFSRMGLQVHWHGTGQFLLPSEVLDAFLLALAECLENVRRHAGVSEAHVTITEDEATVRALVTDAGVGFDIQAVEDHKLGFAESVVARLRDVGGNARLFSVPGAGTTVALEVPR